MEQFRRHVDGLCPHRQGPLGQGEISGRNVVCPWHAWEWDCSTGANDFDPNKKYPLIEYVYPGPQTESVDATFNPRSNNVMLANFGFIVVTVGNRGGNPNRSKWYHTYGYGNLRDYGLADDGLPRDGRPG